jgi:hypothetical protein
MSRAATGVDSTDGSRDLDSLCLRSPVQRYGRRRCKETLVFLITCFSSRFEIAQRLRRVVAPSLRMYHLFLRLLAILLWYSICAFYVVTLLVQEAVAKAVLRRGAIL